MSNKFNIRNLVKRRKKYKEFNFNERQKKILLKAYNQKKFTSKFKDRIFNEDWTILNDKLYKIGYRLSIRIK